MPGNDHQNEIYLAKAPFVPLCRYFHSGALNCLSITSGCMPSYPFNSKMGLDAEPSEVCWVQRWRRIKAFPITALAFPRLFGSNVCDTSNLRSVVAPWLTRGKTKNGDSDGKKLRGGNTSRSFFLFLTTII